MAHMLGIPPVAERRVHDDAVVAAPGATVAHANQVGSVVQPQAVPGFVLQAHALTTHVADAAHDALSAIWRAEHIAVGEELARLHGHEVVHLSQVIALFLQQLAAVRRQLDHVRLGAGLADAIGQVPHARARLQHSHVG